MLERVILHFGTPKTGTTALQNYLFERREELALQGFFYAPVPDRSVSHGYLKDVFRAGPEAIVLAVEAAIQAAPPGTRFIFFSYEALYSRWRKWKTSTKEAMRTLAGRYPLEIWTFFREPLDLITSMRNHQLRIPRRGLDSAASLSIDQWFSQQNIAAECDYDIFVNSISALISPERVKVFPFSGHTVRDVFRELGLPYSGDEKRINVAVSNAVIEAVEDLRKSDLPHGEFVAATNGLIEQSGGAKATIKLTWEILSVAARAQKASESIVTVDGRPLRAHWRRLPPTAQIAYISSLLPKRGLKFTEHLRGSIGRLVAILADRTRKPTRFRIVLHVGTAYTGGGELQDYMYRQRGALAAQGVHYPNAAGGHDFLIGALRSGANAVVAAFDDAISSAPAGAHTIFLSNDMLYSYWRLFKPEALAGLRTIAEQHDLEAWVFFREPVEYLSEYLLKNPRARRAPAGSGRPDFSIEESAIRPKAARECDHSEFVKSVAALLSRSRVKVHAYSGSTIRDVMKGLNLSYQANAARSALALGAAAHYALVALDTIGMDPAQRRAAVDAIIAADNADDGNEVAALQHIPEVRALGAHLRELHGGIKMVNGRTLVEAWNRRRDQN